MPFAASSALSALQNKKIPVGIELYSVRGELVKDLNGTVTAVAKMGYQVVEFYSPYFNWTPEQAKDVRKLLDDLGIKCLSTHNGAQRDLSRQHSEGDRSQPDDRQQGDHHRQPAESAGRRRMEGIRNDPDDRRGEAALGQHGHRLPQPSDRVASGG